MTASGKFFINSGRARAMVPPMNAARKRQMEWLEEVLTKTGLSINQLAEKAKIDPSTIYKFQSGDSEQLRDRTLLRLAQVAQSPPPEVPGLSDGDAVQFDYSNMPDLSEMPGEGRYFPLKITSTAVEKAGIAPGDILIFDSKATPETGDIVCAQVIDYRLGTGDTLIRYYDKPYLLARTDDPQQLRPMIVDDDRVQIRGVLVKQIRVKLFREVA